MAEIYVQSSQALGEVIIQLDGLTQRFRQKAIDLEQEQQALCSKWEGDASTAFNQHWVQERENFNTLLEVLGEYIKKLEAIMQAYEEAEAKNKQIAEN